MNSTELFIFITDIEPVEKDERVEITRLIHPAVVIPFPNSELETRLLNKYLVLPLRSTLF